MAPSEPTSRPDRLAAVFGAPDRPSPTGHPGPRFAGPDGVWPPPQPGLQRARRPVDDPPTEPILLSPSVPVSPLVSPPVPAAGGGRAAVLLRRIVPETWLRARLLPGRPGAVALVLVAAAAAIVAAIGVWMDRPRAEPVPGLPAVVVETPPGAAAPVETPAASAPTATTPAPPPEPLVVAVSGKVHRPGLVEVPPGARVADVLAAAGGALPGADLAGLNLARRVGDGEQVAVGVPPAPDAAPASPPGTYPGPVGPGSPAGGPGAPAGKVDLNVATVAQLDSLPGVGPVMAARIVEWRTRNGRFARVEQLREIDGIGERRFGQLRELVTV